MHTNTIHNEHSDRGQNHADIVDIIFKHFVIVSIETVIQRKWREREWKKNRISITKNNIDGRYPRSVSFLSFFFRCCYDDKQKLCINLTQWEDKNVTEAKQRTKNKGSHSPLLYSRHDSTNALLFELCIAFGFVIRILILICQLQWFGISFRFFSSHNYVSLPFAVAVVVFLFHISLRFRTLPVSLPIRYRF